MDETTTGQFVLHVGKGLEVLADGQAGAGDFVGRYPTDVEMSALQPVMDAFWAYRSTLKTLLSGQYAAFRDVVWPYLRMPCNIIVFGSPDGFIVRQDVADPTSGQVAGVRSWTDLPLADVLPLISDRVLYVKGTDASHNTNGVSLELVESGPDESAERGKVIHRWLLKLETTVDGLGAADVFRPDRMVFAVNDLQIGLEICLTDKSTGRTTSKHLIQSGPLPVGWASIEVFKRSASLAAWSVENARLWADRDVLQSVAAAHLFDKRRRGVDALAEVRRDAAALLESFIQAMNGREENVHVFLKSHPQLINPTFRRTWSKLPLGNALVTDLVIQDANGDYLFVELERADHQLFRGDGQLTEAVTDARNQVFDWFRYVQDNRDTLVREQGLEGLSVSPRGLVVIGRSHTLSESNKRKLKLMAETEPRLRVVTYDELIVGATVLFENLLGPLGTVSPISEPIVRQLDS